VYDNRVLRLGESLALPRELYVSGKLKTNWGEARATVARVRTAASHEVVLMVGRLRGPGRNARSTVSVAADGDYFLRWK
jgi:hypothetical protein